MKATRWKAETIKENAEEVKDKGKHNETGEKEAQQREKEEWKDGQEVRGEK